MARSNDGTTGRRMTAAQAVTAAPLTMACWFFPANVTTYYTLMTQHQSNTVGGGDDDYFVMGINGTVVGDPVTAEAAGGGVYSGPSTTSSYVANTWQHACAVFTSNTSRSVYLNGAGKATDTTAVTPNVAQVNTTQIGGFFSGTGDDELNGRIAEAAIWDVALTDAEVLSLARGVSPLLVRPQNLVRYYPLYGRVSPEPELITGAALTITGAFNQAAHAPIWQPRRPTTYIRGASTQSYSYSASGGLTLAGSSSVNRATAKSAAGGLVLSGAALVNRVRTKSGAGGLSLSGAASFALGRQLSAAGGIQLGGAASLARVAARLSAGGVVFSGSADYSTSGSQQLVVTASGGITISGTAAQLRKISFSGLGGLQLSGSAALATHESTRTVVPAGGLVFGGAATVSTVNTGAANSDLIIRRRRTRS